MFNLVLFICCDVDVGLQCREKNLFFVFYYKSHILNPSPLQWLNFFYDCWPSFRSHDKIFFTAILAPWLGSCVKVSNEIVISSLFFKKKIIPSQVMEI